MDEWIVHLVQGMYSNARSRVRVGEGYSEEFEVKVGVHQGSAVFQLGSEKGRATMPEKGTSRREATSWERVWGIPLLHGLFVGIEG